MKIIGAGFGRTGTKSMQAALQQLGLDPCYHMSEVFDKPHHVAAWQEAIDGRTVDWHQLFEGYHATVDWPGCTFYKELMIAYPDAKVLLTVRDPDRWYDSADSTIYSVGRQFPVSVLRRVIPKMRRTMRMVDSVIWEGTFGGRFEDREHAKAVFERNIEEVKRVVPPERLLVFHPSQGWEPLCAFLGVPVPEGPFPHLNDRQDFGRTVRRHSLMLAAPLAALAVLVALVALVAVGLWGRSGR